MDVGKGIISGRVLLAWLRHIPYFVVCKWYLFLSEENFHFKELSVAGFLENTMFWLRFESSNNNPVLQIKTKQQWLLEN